MNKTSVKSNDHQNKLTVNTISLVSMLDCGRASAVRIGMEAGARIQIGKRVLWNVEKIRTYLDSCATRDEA